MACASRFLHHRLSDLFMNRSYAGSQFFEGSECPLKGLDQCPSSPATALETDAIRRK